MTDFIQQAAAALPRVRSHFHIVTPRPWPNVVAIVDQDDGGMSVTNDAENVVRRLYALGVLQSGDVLVYRDSTGQWDKLVHDGAGRFTGFAPLDPSTRAALNDKVRI